MSDNIHRLSQNVNVQSLSDPVAVTATGNSSHYVDTLGYNKAMIILEIGAVTGTTPSLTPALQDSPDHVTFTAVSGGALPAQTAAVTGVLIIDVDLAKRQRYLNLGYTVSGTTPSFTLAAQVILYRADFVDPGQVNTPVLV